MRMFSFVTFARTLSVSPSQLKRRALGSAFCLASLFSRSSAQTPREPIVPAAQTSGGGVVSAQPFVNAGLSDEPISAGDIVHVSVFRVPDLAVVTRVSASGDIAFPLIGAFHIGGLTSLEAADRLAKSLKGQNLVLNPQVTVTVDSSTTGITILGEVHSPGIYPAPGKHLLSDVLAAAGGVTANTGRVIEISGNGLSQAKEYIPWDPTMHNTSSYDRPVHPGDRIIVRACGIAYVGGKVGKPGAYSLCGSPQMRLSQVLALAGGIQPLSASNHTLIVRNHSDGSRAELEVDANKILLARAADLVIEEDDVIYVPPSTVKNVAKGALEFSLSLASPLLYFYR